MTTRRTAHPPTPNGANSKNTQPVLPILNAGTTTEAMTAWALQEAKYALQETIVNLAAATITCNATPDDATPPAKQNSATAPPATKHQTASPEAAPAEPAEEQHKHNA